MGGDAMSYVTLTFFNNDPVEELASLNLSRKHLAKLEAFKNVALTVTKQCRPRHLVAARFFILTLGALTRYKLASSSSSLSSSSSTWQPLPILTEFLEALGSLEAMPALPPEMNDMDAQMMYCCIMLITDAISILRKQGRKREAAELAVHVLPFLERSKIVSLPFKIDFVMDVRESCSDTDGLPTVSL
jgi:hypothetical protein